MGFQGEEQSANSVHRCPYCESILVQPVDWHEHGDGNWSLERRCPECEWRDRRRYSQDEVERYEVELNRGDQRLLEDLRAVSRANMQEEADRFAAALATDSILPKDFYAS